MDGRVEGRQTSVEVFLVLQLLCIWVSGAKLVADPTKYDFYVW